MQQVAQSWLVYRLTGSAAALGEITFAGQLPLFLLSPLAGVLADRHNRKTLLLFTQTASMLLAALLAVMTALGRVTVWQVEILAVLLGAVNALDVPARQAFVVEMVGRDDLANAIALNSSMFNGARLVGPAVAGLLVAAVGEAWCFALNAASFLAVIFGLTLIRLAPRSRPLAAGSILEEAREGVAYCFRTMPLRSLLLVVGVTSFAGVPYTMLMPVFAERVLGGNAATVGLLMGANGLGALLAALRLASRQSLTGTAQRIVLAALSFGLGLVLFAWSQRFWLSMAAMVGVGFAMITLVGSCNTLIQTMVPDSYRGRVMAVYSMVLFGFSPFGSLLAGSLTDRFGAPVIVTSGALLCILSAALLQSVLPRLRDEARALMQERRADEAVLGSDLGGAEAVHQRQQQTGDDKGQMNAE